MITAGYRLDLIGPFGLFTPDGGRIEIKSRKAAALIALLALAPNGVRTRVWLQLQLWSTRDTAQAQSSLRRELANIAAALRARGAEHLLRRESQRVQLMLDALEVDVHAIAVTAERASMRDRGAFLEGIDLRDCDEFEDWLRDQRGRVADLLASPPPAPRESDGGRVSDILGTQLPTIGELVRSSPPVMPPKPSVVVLPLSCAGVSPEQQWIGESIAEQIGLRLTQFPQLFVVSSIAGAILTSRHLTPVEIAQQLGVRYVLAGSVRADEGGKRISVQLLDGATGQQIWGQSFRSDRSDCLGVEEEITLAAAPQIWSQIDLTERYRGGTQPIREASAYALYWRANALFRAWTRESTLEAVRLTDELVALNPNCALSAALAGFCNAIAFRFGWTVDPQASRRAAILHYQNALRLGADNVEAIGYATGTLVLSGGDMRLADQLVGHALDLLPAYQPTLFWGGFVDLAMGNGARARERLELSLRINPASGVKAYALAGIGLSYLIEGDVAKALVALEPAAAGAPELILAHTGLAVAAALAGEKDKARAAALRVEEMGGSDVATSILRDERVREQLRQGLALALA